MGYTVDYFLSKYTKLAMLALKAYVGENKRNQLKISSQQVTFFTIRYVRLKHCNFVHLRKNWSVRTVTVGKDLELFLVVLIDEFTVLVVRAAGEEPRLMLVQGPAAAGS